MFISRLPKGYRTALHYGFCLPGLSNSARTRLKRARDVFRQPAGSRLKTRGARDGHRDCSRRFFQVAASADAQRGVTLVELVVFIIIVGVAVAGLLLVYTNAVRHSSDPLIRKQMLAVAEAMLEEVQLMHFTYCDPDDANAVTAGAALVGAGNCAAAVEGIGPEAGESRYNLANPFDNVSDYHGFDTATAVPSGINDLSGAASPGLTGYQAQISVSPQALGSAGGVIAATDANGAAQVLRVRVTVTAPDGNDLSLTGYRTRYAPNAVP